MHTLEVNGKSTTFPSCWEEMSEKQFCKVMELLMLFEKLEISLDDFRLRVTLVLVGITISKHKRSKVDKEMIFGNLAILSEYFGWIFSIVRKDQKHLVQLNFSSIKNFIPKINRYKGPADGLTNLSWAQHVKASVAYKMYIRTQNPEYLDEMIANLYTEQGGYDAEKVPFIANEIADVPLYVKQAVFLFYKNNLDFIQNQPLQINGEKINLSILFQGSSDSRKPDGLGLVSLQMSIAESGVFGNMREVGNENLYDVYAYMYKNKWDYLEWKRKQEK